MGDAKQIAVGFIKFYYTNAGSKEARAKNMPVYRAESRVTFEGKEGSGIDAIATIFKESKFAKLAHNVKTWDVQPSPAKGIILFITGDVKIDDNDNAVKFSHFFHLLPDPRNARNFWVSNEIFRLNYG